MIGSSSRVVYVELWDVGGGSTREKESRGMFYRGTDGVLLVWDRSNPKSYGHLRRWLDEVVRVRANEVNEALTRRAFVSSCPVLIVGTKSDAAAARSPPPTTFEREWGATAVHTSCAASHRRAFDVVPFERFFDLALRKKRTATAGRRRIEDPLTYRPSPSSSRRRSHASTSP